ncbi:MAG: hypothetical protein J0M15_16145 [Deltaproteobacteria bacterium]|nr:hypothetical protein [Deltaproteobacteria bacterium]
MNPILTFFLLFSINVLSQDLSKNFSPGFSTEKPILKPDPIPADGLDGIWEKHELYCRQRNNQGKTFEYFRAQLIDSDPQVFYPDVELKISSKMNRDSLNRDSSPGGIIPERYLEKAVLGSSCKLNKNTLQSPIIWFKSKIQLLEKISENGIVYYTMKGSLVDKKINYQEILRCGENENDILNYKFSIPGMVGLMAALGTFIKNDLPEYFNSSGYLQKENQRDYAVYHFIDNNHQDRLLLEFKEEEICKSQGTAVMIFTKKKE